MGHYNYTKPSSPKLVIIPMGQGYNHVNRAPDSSDKRPRKFSDISKTKIEPSKDFSNLLDHRRPRKSLFNILYNYFLDLFEPPHLKISEIHQKFSRRLNEPDVLTNPRKYLGPNWKDVLNFWFYAECLSAEEKDEIYNRYLALDFNLQVSSNTSARIVAKSVIGCEFRDEAWLASFNITGLRVFSDATLELIGSHKLNKNLIIFLPLTNFSKNDSFSDSTTANIKPSKDFSDLEWDSFLRHGSPGELENDKIFISTYEKIKGDLTL